MLTTDLARATGALSLPLVGRVGARSAPGGVGIALGSDPTRPRSAIASARAHSPQGGGISEYASPIVFTFGFLVCRRDSSSGLLRRPAAVLVPSKAEGGEAPTGAGADRRTRGPPCGGPVPETSGTPVQITEVTRTGAP